jgi:hypothetical protein
MTRLIRAMTAPLILATVWSLCVYATTASADVGGVVVPNGRGPVRVPLTMIHTRAGTYKAIVDVRIGNLGALPFTFDTGSTGLHVFANAKLDAAGSGVECSQTPTSVTYGNPPRVIYSGVMCYASLQIGTISAAKPVPIAYLTKSSCPSNLPHCTLPNLNNPKALAEYGVFGAGITGPLSGEGKAPPPILSLPAPYGQTYSLALTPGRGELILGSSVPSNAAAFPLTKVAAVDDEKWSLGKACLFVNRQAIATCLLVSFDTGNGVPWIHNVASPLIPQSGGVVKPSTSIGFGPESSDTEAMSVVAGTEFANAIHVRQVPGREMTNTSIQVFFDRYVTYDAVRGVIFFSPADRN